MTRVACIECGATEHLVPIAANPEGTAVEWSCRACAAQEPLATGPAVLAFRALEERIERLETQLRAAGMEPRS